MFYVYAHVDPTTQKIFYIGKGTRDRIYQKKGRNSMWKLYVKALNEKGFPFEVKVLHSCKTNDEALALETAEIKKQILSGNLILNVNLSIDLSTKDNTGKEESLNDLRLFCKSPLFEIAMFVKDKRHDTGLTQVQFAKRAGVGLRFLRELETGKKTSMHVGLINQVLSMFGHKLLPTRDAR